MKRSESWFIFGVLALLAVVFVPVPSTVLDALLLGSFVLAMLTLLRVLSLRRAAEFSIFPSLLLLATAYRLATNIATTRSILTDAPAEGTAAAGEVIQAFGAFVAGAEPIVGFVIFLILTIVNFIVITKGANRVSEVSARFTLDALPGRQMAIDSELASGSIDEVEAKRRREELRAESSFRGSMDGSMKFVRGDAIAGILITLINIIGGIALGAVKHGMAIGEALSTFTILTIGDGLVSQVPALLISIAAGLLVTRQESTSGMGTQLFRQIGSRPVMRTGALFLAIVGTVAATQSLLLGVELMAAAALLFFLSPRPEKAEETAEAEEEPSEIESLLRVEPLALRIGIRFADKVTPERIEQLRKELAGEMGIVLPGMAVSEDMGLKSGEYVLRVRGVTVGGGEVPLGRKLVLKTETPASLGTPHPDLLGAVWVSQNVPGALEGVEAMFEHVRFLVRRFAADLVSHDDVRRLLEIAGLEADVPALYKVIKNLLREKVPVKDLTRIVETIAGTGEEDPTELARRALGRTICQQLAGPDGVIRAIVLEGPVRREGVFRTGLAIRIREAIHRYSERVLLTSAEDRRVVRKVAETVDPRISVLCREELSTGIRLEVTGVIGGGPSATAAS